MKALIVQNAYIKNASQLSQAQRIGEELAALGVEAHLVKNFDLAAIEGGKIVAKDYAFCIFLDKDRVAARLLEGAGLRIFNSARAMEDCDDKMLTSIRLASAGLPVPDCVYAPLCYYEGEQPDDEFLHYVERKLGLPLVAKTNYGSLGAGVTLIETYKKLRSYERENMLLPHFYQRLIGAGGEDVRVIVVGGKFLCAMKRSNASDFRSNIELGGIGVKYEADPAMIALCEEAARVLELDYCGVDVLTDGSGNRYICEVNSNAFFAAAERVCNVNVAAAYARHALQCLQNNPHDYSKNISII